MDVNLLYDKNNFSENICCKYSPQSLNSKLYADTVVAKDLKLDLLLDTMADNDVSLRKICKDILLSPSTDTADLYLRQGILKDAITSPEFFLQIYHHTIEIQEQTSIYQDLNHPRYSKIITSMKKVIAYSEMSDLYLQKLEQIYHLIAKSIDFFHSERLLEFCMDFTKNYSQKFLKDAKIIIQQLLLLKVDTEITIGGHIGFGLKLTDIHLHNIFNEVRENTKSQKNIFLTNRKKDKHADGIILLDSNILANCREEIIEASFLWILKTLSEFTTNCKNFFDTMREMFGFYTGATRLHEAIKKNGALLSFPKFSEQQNHYEFINLTDPGLILKEKKQAVGNTLTILNKKLCIITGSNQGGKTTFLRSIGLAQLMAQAGLFVTAEIFVCNIYSGIFTHFTAEEDKTLHHGLLEEELSRLNDIVLHMKPGSLLLMNESFSTTMEYDAGILAEEIISALIDSQITIYFVTHLYSYTHKLFKSNNPDYGFFRAVREEDGSRTYKIEIGEPLNSSYALDLFHQILS